jgi:polysaccharide biosynthesis transport protein
MPVDPPDSPDLTAGLLPGGESTIDVREYLHKLRRQWKLVVAVVLLAVTVAVVQYLITPKEYVAQTVVQIERRNLTMFTNSQSPWLENWWNFEYYPTQYQLLESRGLAERVVKALSLMDDPDFNPGAAADADGHQGSDADKAALGRLANRLRSGLTVDPIKSTQLVTLSYRSSSPEFASRAVNAFAEAFIDWDREKGSLTVGSASSFLAEQIEKIKQEIADRESQLQSYSRTQDIVDVSPDSNVAYQRLASLNKDYMDVVRDRIEKQARYEELVNTPKETVADAASSGAVSSLRKDQLELERKYDTQLKTFKPDWPPMVELKAQIDRGRQHLDQVVQKEAQRAIDAAQASYQTLQRQEQKIGGEIERAKSDALDQNMATVGFTNLQVEIKTRRELLDELLRRQSETEVALRLQENPESNIRIIDRALVPGSPFRPSLKTNLSTGLLAGLLLGIGLVFVLDFLDRSVKTAEELENLLGLPVLAVIPDVSDKSGRYGYGYGKGYGYGYGYGASRRRAAARAEARPEVKAPPQRWIEKKTAEPARVELAPHDQPRKLVSEAYRSLRTALLLSSAEELRVVAITSAEAGEGKTATVANLAVVMAQLGRRVLVVDADLRKPRQHEVFQVSNREGLVSFLTGSIAGEQIVNRTSVPNLFLVASGPIPPNPSELLASERMHNFLAMARERFDFIILDTPPALAVTDATLIGSAADGVVLCFRAGKVQRDDTRACRDRLLRADVRILGAVLNRYHERGGRYGKRYHQYTAYAEEGSTESANSAA